MRHRLYAITKVIIVLIVLLALSPDGWGHLPDTGPEIDTWFEQLIAPDTGVPCCDLIDCRPVASRPGPEGWQALVDGAWMPIPQDKVVTDTVNPLRSAVLCWSKTLGMMCFVPPPPGANRNRGS